MFFLGIFSQNSHDFADFSVRGIDEMIFICIILRKYLSIFIVHFQNSVSLDTFNLSVVNGCVIYFKVLLFIRGFIP